MKSLPRLPEGTTCAGLCGRRGPIVLIQITEDRRTNISCADCMAALQARAGELTYDPAVSTPSP